MIGSRVYVGGNFTKTTSDTTRNKLAAVDAATGNLIKDWNPKLDAGSDVINAIDVDGPTVYVGGSFSSIGNFSRDSRTNMNVAALDSVNGDPKKWNPDTFFRKPSVTNSLAPVNALVVRGPVLYVGGDFTAVGGTERNFLIALDAKTGDLIKDWNPKISTSNSTDSLVHALAVSGSTVYAGGRFATVNGLPRNSIVAIDSASGLPLSTWNPNVQTGTGTGSGTVRTITINGSAVYFGGNFNQVKGVKRTNAASVTIADGNPVVLLDWNPEMTDGATTAFVNAIKVGGAMILPAAISPGSVASQAHPEPELEHCTAILRLWEKRRKIRFHACLA
ncbi:MAG: PQQ-binding-like beta-propeller repeat protein [bacterium]